MCQCGRNVQVDNQEELHGSYGISLEVDTSDCDEVTESRPPFLRLWEEGTPERNTEDCFSQSEYIEIDEVSGGDMSSRHECISRPDSKWDL